MIKTHLHIRLLTLKVFFFLFTRCIYVNLVQRKRVGRELRFMDHLGMRYFMEVT